MSTPTASRPPAGMPPHLWELAKRDARGDVPERLREAPDTGADAPPGVRAIARRAATVGATLGVAAVATVFGAGSATADAPVDAPVDLSAAEGAVDLDGFDSTGAMGGTGSGAGTGSGSGTGSGGGAGAGDATFGASTGTSGSTADGPVSSDLGATFQVQEGPPGAEQTITVSIFQDVTVVETADGMFQVDAYQYIVITDSDGNEYVFKEHYQVTVPDPPGQETDLLIHETGHVHIVENADGSFTPVTVDFGISVTTGADGDGRDEIGIVQQQSVQITEYGTPDGDDLITILDSHARTSTEDVGDEAHTSIDQAISTGSGPAPAVTSGPFPAGTGSSSQTASGHPWDEHPSGAWDEPAGPTPGGTPGTGPTSAGTTSTATSVGPVVHVDGDAPLGSSLTAEGTTGIAWSEPSSNGDRAAPETPSPATTATDPAPAEPFSGPGRTTDSPAGSGTTDPSGRGEDTDDSEGAGSRGDDRGSASGADGSGTTTTEGTSDSGRVDDESGHEDGGASEGSDTPDGVDTDADAALAH